MLDRLDRTIAAVASAPGPGLRGIIRVSGADVASVIRATVILDDESAFAADTRAVRHTGTFLVDDAHSLRLPLAVLLWPNGRSYTGEPMAEIHMIGSPPLIEAVLSRLFENGTIPAESGEFTLRAFLNRRIDLVQAEAVLGVIDADDQKLLELALGQLAGGLSSQLSVVREQLLIDLADLEAGLDFVEEDIEFVDRNAMANRLQSSLALVERLRAQADARLQTTTRRRVMLAGLPNAGKSSLFNEFLGSDRALVSTIAGTTRDYLTANVEWNGLPIELIDTAGWEADAVGLMAQGMTARDVQWQRSHLVIWCSACNQTEQEAELDDQLLSREAATTLDVFRIWTKCDLAGPTSSNEEQPMVSILSPESVEGLRSWIVGQLRDSSAGGREMLASTGARCRDCLASAARSLSDALSLALEGADDTLISLEVRRAGKPRHHHWSDIHRRHPRSHLQSVLHR